MALRTKLNTNEDGETNEMERNGMEGINDLDMAYVNNLKQNGVDEDLLAQFMDITKQLEDINKNK